jgi:hypothetical protein
MQIAGKTHKNGAKLVGSSSVSHSNNLATLILFWDLQIVLQCAVLSTFRSLAACILTLILLTLTKWWAPANASKWLMGFHSAFKELMVEV